MKQELKCFFTACAGSCRVCYHFSVDARADAGNRPEVDDVHPSTSHVYRVDTVFYMHGEVAQLRERSESDKRCLDEKSATQRQFELLHANLQSEETVKGTNFIVDLKILNDLFSSFAMCASCGQFEAWEVQAIRVCTGSEPCTTVY